jgi:hypothetical protein
MTTTAIKLPVFYLGIMVNKIAVNVQYPRLYLAGPNLWRPMDMSSRPFKSVQDAATFIWELKETSSGYDDLPIYFGPPNSENTELVTDKDHMIELVLKYS